MDQETLQDWQSLQNWKSVFGDVNIKEKEKEKVFPNIREGSKTFTRKVRDNDGDEIITIFTESDMFDKLIFISEQLEKTMEEIHKIHNYLSVLDEKVSLISHSLDEKEEDGVKDKRDEISSSGEDDKEDVSGFQEAISRDDDEREGEREGEGEREREREVVKEFFQPFYNNKEYIFEENYTELIDGRLNMTIMISGDSEKITLYPFGNKEPSFKCNELFHTFDVLDENKNKIGITYLRFDKLNGIPCLSVKENKYEDLEGKDGDLINIERPFYLSIKDCGIN